MKRVLLQGIVVSLSALLLLGACQKNTAPVTQQSVGLHEKAELIRKIKADTLYKQWQQQQQRVFELMVQAVKSGKMDTAKLKSLQKTNNEVADIDRLKEAGVVNAEEFVAAEKKAKEMLRALWKKYPDVSKLSMDDFKELGKLTPSK
ncbi:MAG TPA: hypothetical protein VD993_08945 [Chitinophagaceae bacterium]|nr:hypothetical protein [Chitinophagaceae bacterium]